MTPPRRTILSRAAACVSLRFGARQSKAEDGKPKNGKKERAPRRKFLETYCENLTQKARDGKTDRIIGRDREIYRTIRSCAAARRTTPA